MRLERESLTLGREFWVRDGKEEVSSIKYQVSRIGLQLSPLRREFWVWSLREKGGGINHQLSRIGLHLSQLP